MTGSDQSRELRRFGLIVGGIFGIIAVWPVALRGEGVRGWAGLIAVGLIVLGLVAPRALGPVHRLWMRAGEFLGWVNTRVILGATYCLLMTTVGLIMRLVGHDPLDRRLGDRESYWTAHHRAGDAKATMERRF